MASPSVVLAARPEWLDRVKALALDSVSSPHSRRAYDRALSAFLGWYLAEQLPGLSKVTVQRYRVSLEASGLAPASINVALSAIRKLVQEAADNALVAPELAAGVARIRGVRRLGTRVGNWLTAAEATALLNTPDANSLKGARDRAILALLIGCGLRRAELVALDVGSLDLRDSRWVLPDLVGKGNRLRTVAVPVWAKILVEQWVAAAGLNDGPLFRPLNKGGAVLPGRLDEDTIWVLVRHYGAVIGHPSLAPHDLRRTCAKLCRASGGDLEQIQFLLGHASIQTTERYLGSKQNLVQAVNDNLPVEPQL
jgi:integrase